MILLLVGAFWEPALAFAWTLREWEKIGKEGLQRRQERAAAAEVRAGQEDVERARMTEAAPVPEERSVGVRP
ncbi:MAG: hypothetical protein HYU66_08430 [Armatimonadetes bacterium]|nr:hypothetical protein [Armatimonadota bacterium]